MADVLTTAVFWGAVTRSRDLEERCWIDYGEPWFVVDEVLAPELVAGGDERSESSPAR